MTIEDFDVIEVKKGIQLYNSLKYFLYFALDIDGEPLELLLQNLSIFYSSRAIKMDY